MNAIKLFKFKTKNSVQSMTLVVFFYTYMQTKKNQILSKFIVHVYLYFRILFEKL